MPIKKLASVLVVWIVPGHNVHTVLQNACLMSIKRHQRVLTKNPSATAAVSSLNRLQMRRLRGPSRLRSSDLARLVVERLQ